MGELRKILLILLLVTPLVAKADPDILGLVVGMGLIVVLVSVAIIVLVAHLLVHGVNQNSDQIRTKVWPTWLGGILGGIIATLILSILLSTDILDGYYDIPFWYYPLMVSLGIAIGFKLTPKVEQSQI